MLATLLLIAIVAASRLTFYLHYLPLLTVRPDSF